MVERRNKNRYKVKDSLMIKIVRQFKKNLIKREEYKRDEL